ncbi:MAG: hypothetical protein R3C19_24585 [Planctomycetaceae bacterium]
MRELSGDTQRRVRVVEQIYALCRDLQSDLGCELCLEDYERCVLLRFGQELPEAAVAWIEVIVNCLRNGEAFDPTNYMHSGEASGD